MLYGACITARLLEFEEKALPINSKHNVSNHIRDTLLKLLATYPDTGTHIYLIN